MIILPKQYISLLESALKIYSPSDFEKDISNFLFNTMKDLGFNNIRIDSADNVIGEIGSGNPTLLYVDIWILFQENWILNPVMELCQDVVLLMQNPL